MKTTRPLSLASLACTLALSAGCVSNAVDAEAVAANDGPLVFSASNFGRGIVIPVVTPPSMLPPASTVCRTIADANANAVARGIDLGQLVQFDLTVVDPGVSYVVREFERGAILQPQGGCATEIHGALFDEYKAQDNLYGHYNFSASSGGYYHSGHRFGVPTSDVFTAPNGAQVSVFGTAAIVWSQAHGAHAVWGRIFSDWKTRSGSLGVPLSSERAAPAFMDFGTPGAMLADFENGSLYEPPYVGPAVVQIAHAASLKLRSMVASSRDFSRPSWNSKAIGSGSETHFEGGGEIYVRPDGSAVSFYGPIVGQYNTLGGVQGWLGWPQADLSYVPSLNANCVTFDHGVICQYLGTGSVVVATSLAAIDAPPPAIKENADYPSNMSDGWTDAIQGVAHYGSDWYITTKPGLYRIGFDQDLAQVKSRTSVGNPAGYNHFGDPDVRNGRLWVPVSGPAGFGIAEYMLPGLQFIGVATLSQSSDSPWVAFNPVDGRLYTSLFDTNEILAYDVSENIPALRLARRIPMRHNDGTLAQTGLQRVQGGAFSPRGILYLSSEGYSVPDGRLSITFGNDMPNGLLGFDANTGRLLESVPVEFTPGRTCVYVALFVDECFDSGDELEGLDFLDVSTLSNAPAGITGQLHLIMGHNSLGDDAIWFKHFTSADPGKTTAL